MSGQIGWLRGCFLGPAYGSPPIRQAGPAAMTCVRVRRSPGRLAEDQSTTFVYDRFRRSALTFAWKF